MFCGELSWVNVCSGLLLTDSPINQTHSVHTHFNPCDCCLVSADTAVSHCQCHSDFSRSVPNTVPAHFSVPLSRFPYYRLAPHMSQNFTQKQTQTTFFNVRHVLLTVRHSWPWCWFPCCCFTLSSYVIHNDTNVFHYIYWHHCAGWVVSLAIREKYREELYYPTINYFTFIPIQWAWSSFFYRNRTFLCCRQLPARVS